MERDRRHLGLRALVALSRLNSCAGSSKGAMASVMSVVGSVRRHVGAGTMRRTGVPRSTRHPLLSLGMEKQMRHPCDAVRQDVCLCNANYSCRPSSTTCNVLDGCTSLLNENDHACITKAPQSETQILPCAVLINARAITTRWRSPIAELLLGEQQSFHALLKWYRGLCLCLAALGRMPL